MFSIISNNVSSNDLNEAVENVRSTRPFELVRTASYTNIKLEPGYQGSNVILNSYFFSDIEFDGFPPIPGIIVQPGDRILLFGQTNKVENGLWSVVSKISGYVNIQRVTEYAQNTPIKSGQFIIIIEGLRLRGAIIKNETPQFDSNKNRIISYNGISEQIWKLYGYINPF